MDAGELHVLADDGKPLFLQHAEGSGVVTGDMGVQRACLHVDQKQRQRSRGDAPAPVFAADPVPHLPFAGLLEPQDVAGDASIEEYGLLQHDFVVQDPVPVRHERIPLPGRESGHPGCIAV